MNRGILALVPPNPQGEQKERSHGRLEKCRKKAENSELITLCHESEEICTSDLNTP